MIAKRSYQMAFLAALVLHMLMAFFLFKKPENKTYALAHNRPKSAPRAITPAAREQTVIKAKSVDQQQVTKTVNRLKAERLKAQQAQEKKQRELVLQADKARKTRIAEQKRLQQLKKESAKLALARKKALAEEEQRLKQLAQQQVAEKKRLAEMKRKQQALQKQQQADEKRLAELKQKQAAEEQARKAREAKAREEALEKKQQEAELQAALDAEKKVRIAGEVDKYKALIVQAISQKWILPDNADRGLSSQFRIRLAPDGSVVDVSLTRSSGDSVLDRSARAAIYKAAPLPVPREAEAFNVFRDISLTVRPENARG